MDSNMDETLEKILQFSEKLLKTAIKVGQAHVPDIEKFLIDTLDAMFAPRQILRQIVMISVLQLVVMLYQSTSTVFDDVMHLLSQKGRKEKQLLRDLKSAKSFAVWLKVAEKLDTLRGMDRWRREPKSALYDCKMLTKRINGTMDMLARGEVFDLMFRLRGGLARDQFGMQHEGLFSCASAGTKHLVEKYHDTMAYALDYICDASMVEEEFPTDARLAFFNETRHSYGRTALLLSGGAYLGYYHIGVLKALWSNGLLPRVISGASAGSLMTALIGTRTEQEFADLFVNPAKAQEKVRMDFFLFSQTLQSEVAKKLQYLVPQGLRWLTNPLLSSVFDKKILNLDTDHFKMVVLQNIGTYTFQEAFDRTGRIINITVAPMNTYDPPRLLNYLTAPHVCVWSAAAASCALPGIFDSISLIVKEPNGSFRPENEWTRQHLVEEIVDDEYAAYVKQTNAYSDGSLENDLPMQQLSELFNVNHFIVSQVNPHSAILSSMHIRASVWSHPVYGALAGYVRFLKAQCRDWVKNIVNLLVYRNNAPVWSSRRGLSQTLTQDYEGRDEDITIMPWVGHIPMYKAFASTIKNPTLEEFLDVVEGGERATWPHIPRIRAHCAVEMTLDQCVQRLRKRISVEAMRKNATARMQQGLQVGAEEGAGMDSAGMPKDRTPSFYTSRSILHLSGLSVADPLPAGEEEDDYEGGGGGDGGDSVKSGFSGSIPQPQPVDYFAKEYGSSERRRSAAKMNSAVREALLREEAANAAVAAYSASRGQGKGKKKTTGKSMSKGLPASYSAGGMHAYTQHTQDRYGGGGGGSVAPLTMDCSRDDLLEGKDQDEIEYEENELEAEGERERAQQQQQGGGEPGSPLGTALPSGNPSLTAAAYKATPSSSVSRRRASAGDATAVYAGTEGNKNGVLRTQEQGYGKGGFSQSVGMGGASRRGSASSKGSTGGVWGAGDASANAVLRSMKAEEFLNLSVPMGEVPLQGEEGEEEEDDEEEEGEEGEREGEKMERRRRRQGGRQDGAGQMMRTYESSELLRDYSQESLKDETVIHKTTNMANFYYKKSSKSDDQIASRRHDT